MKKQNVYVGNSTKNGIINYALINGKLVLKYETNDFERCTYMTQNETHIYGVIETKEGSIVSYKKNADKLKYVDKKSSYGEGPCHIEINKENRLIFVSNYNNGYLTILKMKDDGTIGEKIYSKVENSKKSHMHCVKTSIDNKYFFAVDLGQDVLTAFEIKENNIKELDKIKFRKDTQPRHIAISGKNIYVITEKSCELYSIKFDNQKLQITNVISLLPKDVEIKENYTGCAIKTTKDFKYIYATIRGHNSISIYKVSKNNVKLIQNISCEGNLPRDLEIDKKGKYVLVANQKSNEITVFKRNLINGKLQFRYKEKVQAPTCVVIE